MRKNLSFVEFKDFCFLKLILELIARSLVNIKRRRRSLLCWQNSKSSKLHLRFVTNYKSSFYSLYSFKAQIILSYFNFLCCFSFLSLLNSILVSCFVLLSRHQYNRFKWTTKNRSKSDLDHKENEKNDVRTKVHDAARMSRLLYTKSFLHETNCWRCHGLVSLTQSGDQYQGGLVSEVKRRGLISSHNSFFFFHFFDLLHIVTR